MVKVLVIGAEVGRRAVSMVSKIPALDVAIARGLVASGRLSPSAAEAGVEGGRGVVAGFQERAAGVLFASNATGAEKLIRAIDLDAIKDPRELERLATRYAKLRWHDVAFDLRRRAVELDPTSAHRWIGLARSLLRADNGGVVNDPIVGLTSGTKPRTDEARAALKRADELAPDNGYVLYERGKLEFAHGDPAAGLRMMARAVELQPRLAWWLELAAAYRKPHIADYDKALDAYEQALRLNPRSVTAFRGVIITGCRADQDWARLWKNAELYESARKRPRRRKQLIDGLRPLFQEKPDQIAVSQALVQLEIARVKGQRLSWPTTSLVIYRLQFAGRIVEGFRLRRGLAKRTLSWLGTASAGHTRHRQKVLAALAYLGRNGETQELIDPLPWEPGSRLEKQRLEKLSADTHLLEGRLAPYLQYCEQRRRELSLPGDERMREFVAGKRVAVVGPADTGDRLGELIDGYDVILRPRYLPEIVREQAERLGSRTDIAYFSGRELGDFMGEAAAAVDTGDLKLVVGRGLSFNSFEGELPEWLRFYRHEYSICYHGAPMAIVRMIYDVLQFEPAEVSIFNVDFYTGTNAFGKGYREGKDAGLGPYSIVNEILLAHDLSFDFRLLQAFQATGLVNAKGVAGEVLALTEPEYLQKLQESPALGGVSRMLDSLLMREDQGHGSINITTKPYPSD